MKQSLLFLCALFAIMSCNSGLNQSFMEPLDSKTLKSVLDKDPEFGPFYDDLQELRDMISSSATRQAKYGDISYKRLYKYTNLLTDTTVLSGIYKSVQTDYEKQYEKYDQAIDSAMDYWREYYSTYSLDSLVKVEPKDIRTTYYSYIGGVKDVNIGFLITPLKGRIDQLVFRYCIKPQITSDGKMDYYDSHRCLASSPVTSPKTLYWEADYSDEKSLQRKTMGEVLRDYVFIIEVEEVRLNGENMEQKISAIPKHVLPLVKNPNLCSDDDSHWKSDVIVDCIDPEFVPITKKMKEETMAYYKKADPAIYEMFVDLFGDEMNAMFEDID